MTTFCACVYIGLTPNSLNIWTVLGFLLSVSVMICGIRINYKFFINLKIERRNTPLGRKGNVIEPIMSWHCKTQIFYWSFYLLYFATIAYIPEIWMNSIWCDILFHFMLTGRLIVAYNSLFVVLIRYLYIVHNQRANQWHFEKVGNWFRVLSVIIPALISIFGVFFLTLEMYTHNPKFEKCYFSQKVMEEVQRFQPTYIWLSNYLPEPVMRTFYYLTMLLKAIGFINIIEAYFYYNIYQSITK